MLHYCTNAGERLKPALELYGELSVDQAHSVAQNWVAEVLQGGNPYGDKAQAPYPHGQGIVLKVHRGLFEAAQQAHQAARLP